MKLFIDTFVYLTVFVVIVYLMPSVETLTGEIPSGNFSKNQVHKVSTIPTKIEYRVPEEGNVSLKVYNIIGGLESLVNEVKPAGKYSAVFSASPGVYIYELILPDTTITKKIVVGVK